MGGSVKEGGEKAMWLVPGPGHSVPLRGHLVPDISRVPFRKFRSLMTPQQDRLDWLAGQETTRFEAHEGLKERLLVQLEL